MVVVQHASTRCLVTCVAIGLQIFCMRQADVVTQQLECLIQHVVHPRQLTRLEQIGAVDDDAQMVAGDLVEKTPCAIGYSGLAYATDHVKMACIATEDGGGCVDPSVATASDRSYPIARPLFMYTNGEPQGDVKNYLDWILSDEGQCIILGKGYAPVRSVTCD